MLAHYIQCENTTLVLPDSHSIAARIPGDTAPPKVALQEAEARLRAELGVEQSSMAEALGSPIAGELTPAFPILGIAVAGLVHRALGAQDCVV
jgi:hypothetical protein